MPENSDPVHGDLLRRYVAPEWRAAAALLVLLLAGAAVQLVNPRLLASFIDSPSTRPALAYLLLALIGQAVSVAEAYLSESLALTATNRLRADLTRHCLRLDLSFHNEHRPGEMIQRIDGDVASLTNFFSRFFVALAANALLLVGVLVMLATIDWRLGAGLTVFSALILVTLYSLRSAARPHWDRFMEAEAEQSGFLEEQLSATEDLRSSAATPYVMRRYFEHASGVLRRQARAMLIGNGIGALSRLLFTIGTAASLAAAAWFYIDGDATIGTVFLVFMYSQMLSAPIQTINRQLQDLQTATAAINRVDALFSIESTLAEDGDVELADGALGVQFDGVSFSYVAGEQVLDDVSLTVAPGTVLGVVGRTGSGKTTIARLLLRFYDPDVGRACIGGVDLTDTAEASRKQRVGLVSQDVHILRGTIRDNITLFDAGIPDARVTAVLEELGLGAWLAVQPHGLDTVIDSDGHSVSGGEAQLLAFARVFLRDPGVVILDEATSRLDPATEELVHRAVIRLFEGRTAVVIAHRLGTVLSTDELVVLEHGRIVERGPTRELAADETTRFASLLATGLESADGDAR